MNLEVQIPWPGQHTLSYARSHACPLLYAAQTLALVFKKSGSLNLKIPCISRPLDLQLSGSIYKT